MSVEGRAGVVDAPPGVDEAALLEEHFDQVMEQLIELERGPESRISDSDISARLAAGDVQITVVVEAGNPEEAAEVGNAAIRCAKKRWRVSPAD